MTIDLSNPTMDVEVFTAQSGSTEAELLIREARLATRRRRFRMAVVLSMVVIVVVALILVVANYAHSTGARTGTGTAKKLATRTQSIVAASLVGSDGIVAQGSHIWVSISRESPTSNFFGVTELNAHSGTLVRVIHSKADAFREPGVMAVADNHLWVANDQSVTELNATTGALIRVINAKSDAISGPNSIVVSGARVWVVNNTNSVTELSANTGSLIRVLSGATYGFKEPGGIVTSGANAWVINLQGNSISEINTRNGNLTRILNARSGNIGPQKYGTGASFAWEEPIAMAISGVHLWVMDVHAFANGATQIGSLVEFNANTGSYVRRVATAPDGLNFTSSMVAAGTHLWLTNSNDAKGSLVELNSSIGSLAHIVNGNAYSRDGLVGSDGLATDGSRIEILDIGGPHVSVTLLNAATGALLRVIK